MASRIILKKGRCFILCTPTFTLLSPQTLAACAEIAATAPDPWSRANLETAMADSRRLVLLALANGTPAAFACCLLIDDGADLEQIAVLPAFRRQGLARALIRQATAWLRARGAARLLLEVRAENAPAIALYQGLGFKTLARRPGMYRHPPDDGFLMGLGLEEPEHSDAYPAK